MSELTIKTDNKPRDLVGLCDLPPDVAKDFDYIDEEDSHSARFVKYRGFWYDTGDMMAVPKLPADSPLNNWDVYAGDSFFSGVVIKFVSDFEQVIVGTYIS